jgi:hypothetical protein
MGRLWMLALVVGLGACSSRSAEVETGPAPQATRIPGTLDPGSVPARKNEHVPENASPAARFGIPPGHLPPPGRCRVWIPSEPPGKQKTQAAGDCATVSRQVPAHGWLVYRPGEGKKEVVVREYGAERQVVSIKVFDIVTGAFLRELDPDPRS